jgi:sugar phosphate permease
LIKLYGAGNWYGLMFTIAIIMIIFAIIFFFFLIPEPSVIGLKVEEFNEQDKIIKKLGRTNTRELSERESSL